VVGDATDDDIIAQTGLERARGPGGGAVVDKDNLYLTVSGRQSNPGVRIVARCAELRTSRRSGGRAPMRWCRPTSSAACAWCPSCSGRGGWRFLDDMLRDRRATFRIEEIQLGDGRAGLGRQLRDARAASVRDDGARGARERQPVGSTTPTPTRSSAPA